MFDSMSMCLWRFRFEFVCICLYVNICVGMFLILCCCVVSWVLHGLQVCPVCFSESVPACLFDHTCIYMCLPTVKCVCVCLCLFLCVLGIPACQSEDKCFVLKVSQQEKETWSGTGGSEVPGDSENVRPQEFNDIFGGCWNFPWTWKAVRWQAWSFPWGNHLSFPGWKRGGLSPFRCWRNWVSQLVTSEERTELLETSGRLTLDRKPDGILEGSSGSLLLPSVFLPRIFMVCPVFNTPHLLNFN